MNESQDESLFFPIITIQEGMIQNPVNISIVSQEEICEPVQEYFTEIIIDKDVDPGENKVESDDEYFSVPETSNESSAPNKEELDTRENIEYSDSLAKANPNQTDEKMAVEALRQLGNFPKFETPKPVQVAKETCKICRAMFDSKAILQVHLAETHQSPKVYKCNICGSDFQRPSSLSNHLKIHTYVAGRAINPEESPTKVKANISEVFVSDVEESDGTVQWHVPVFKYETCKSTQSTSIDTLQEIVIPSEEIIHIDPSNDQHYVTVHALDNSKSVVKIDALHYENFQDLTKAGETEAEDAHFVGVECNLCDGQFQDEAALVAHQEICNNREMLRGLNSRWRKHECEECGKRFTTRQKMHRHQWIHRSKKYCCEVCSLQFKYQTELDKHRLLDHPKNSDFICTKCGKSFASRQGLWEHGKAAHMSSPLRFQCATCSKKFTSRWESGRAMK